MLEELGPTKSDYDFTKVRVKQEKLSPPPKQEKDADELLAEILPLTNLFGSSENSNEVDESEEKKLVEPAKSSNEILAELFKVFNAAPPESLLNDDYLLKKKKKHKKKDKKHRKKSKKHGRSSSDEEGLVQSTKHKKKHKKKDKKHKKSKKKSRSHTRERSYDKASTVKEERMSPKHSEESDLILSDVEELMVYPKPMVDTSIVKKEKGENGSKKIVIKSLKNTNIFKEAERIVEDRIKKGFVNKHHRKDESSDFTLSDEEEYLREKEMYYKNSGYYERDERYRRHQTRSRYSTSKDRFRANWRDRSRSRHRRRTRSRSRSQELMIDKKRLLEIARKNAITMFKSGSLPGTQGMSQEVKDKVVMKMRYGGKTVEELTEFCKKLSKGESLNDLSSLSSNEDSDYDRHGKEKVFYHPFVLKDRGPIVMNIKNATPIPPKTAEQTKAILMQYPVSSGQMHRLTENEWVPVSPKRAAPPPLPPPKPQAPKNVFEKPLPTEQQQPAFIPLPPNSESGVLSSETNTTLNTPDSSTSPARVSNSLSKSVPVGVPSPTPAPQSDSIFPQSNQNLDVSSIISQRLNAMRKLQENPEDPEALKMMYNSQREMSVWATSNFTPGQFTGSTGAKILSAQELTSGQQAWAKRDQLTTTVPVSGGMGMRLLQKMGWKPGEGLGKEKNGALQPLLLEVKLDKKGLLANEEDPTQINRPRRKKPVPSISKAQQDLENKHPVSLLGELAAKRKWGAPVYDLVNEDGPAHQKNFIYKVIVNSITYTPSVSCNNKKKAKALAAKYSLQQMGVLPV